jgi:predicted DNA-binding transcriptional regulator YafY
MKSERLISLLLLLQSRQQSTARALADTLEVSERTVYRDVDALSAAGVPVYANRGSTGGITLADGYRRALMHFNEDEVRALFFSGESPLADLGLDRGLDRALSKLHGGFADVMQKAADKARSRIHLDSRRWNQAQPPRDMLTTLRRAVWDDRCIRMTYEDRNRRGSERVVEPLGLVSKAGVWYLIAQTAGEPRTYRVERIVTAQELEEHFERPRGFDLERYWSSSSAIFAAAAKTDRIDVDFRVQCDAVERLNTYWQADVLDRNETEALVRVSFPNAEIAIFQAIAWADVARAIEPAGLCEQIVARARQVVDVTYAGER